METYFAAKRRLFDGVDADAGSWPSTTPGAAARRRARRRRHLAIEGPADWQAADLRSDLAGSTFTVRSPAGEAAVELPLRGRFNVANALVRDGRRPRARAWSSAAMAAALRRARPVPGRFEPVDEGQEFAVLVDYAHTPDSLENVLLRRARAGRAAA